MQINTVGQLFAMGAEGTAYAWGQGQSRQQTLLGALQARFGSAYEFSTRAVASLARRLAIAITSALQIEHGDKPGDVPHALAPELFAGVEAPDGPANYRYRVTASVSGVDPDTGESVLQALTYFVNSTAPLSREEIYERVTEMLPERGDATTPQEPGVSNSTQRWWGIIEANDQTVTLRINTAYRRNEME